MRTSAITYGSRSGQSGKAQRNAEYYLATTAECMQFYLFRQPQEGQQNTWTLIDRLDRSVLLAAGNKPTAKAWAKLLGLKTWTYVRV